MSTCWFPFQKYISTQCAVFAWLPGGFVVHHHSTTSFIHTVGIRMGTPLQWHLETTTPLIWRPSWKNRPPTQVVMVVRNKNCNNNDNNNSNSNGSPSIRMPYIIQGFPLYIIIGSTLPLMKDCPTKAHYKGHYKGGGNIKGGGANRRLPPQKKNTQWRSCIKGGIACINMYYIYIYIYIYIHIPSGPPRTIC